MKMTILIEVEDIPTSGKIIHELQDEFRERFGGDAFVTVGAEDEFHTRVLTQAMYRHYHRHIGELADAFGEELGEDQDPDNLLDSMAGFDSWTLSRKHSQVILMCSDQESGSPQSRLRADLKQELIDRGVL